jgi:acyl-CoA synthetase (AMP-forming)/AMP-acid ligase II
MGALDTRDYERGPQPSRSEAYGDPARLTMADRLEHQARSLPDRRAFSFVEDGGGVNTRTWAELAAGARAVAAVLADLPRTQEQPRALLLPDNCCPTTRRFSTRCSAHRPRPRAVIHRPRIDLRR